MSLISLGSNGATDADGPFSALGLWSTNTLTAVALEACNTLQIQVNWNSNKTSPDFEGLEHLVLAQLKLGGGTWHERCGG